MSGIVVLVIIIGLLWIAAQQSEKRGEERHRIAFEATKHLPSFLRESTGVGPWLEMDNFYLIRNVHVRCTSCTKDTIFVSNANTAHETEYIDVHFKEGKLRIMYGNRSLFDGDPLMIMSYPQETFPLKEDSPPPKESGSYYSIWVDHFKKAPNRTGAFTGSHAPPLPVESTSADSTIVLEPDRYEQPDRLSRLLKAAKQGDENAQCILGELYSDPTSELFDNYEALTWCRKAAENGNARAQSALAALYSLGIGFPKSDTEAYFWAYLGAIGGHSDWGNKGYTSKLTPTEIAQTEERAEAWIAARQVGEIDKTQRQEEGLP
jgi:hypothetical protein